MKKKFIVCDFIFSQKNRLYLATGNYTCREQFNCKILRKFTIFDKEKNDNSFKLHRTEI